MAKKDLVQLWIRGDDKFRTRVNDKAEKLGFKTADYLRQLIDFGIGQDDPFFFLRGDDFCPHKTTKEPADCP